MSFLKAGSKGLEAEDFALSYLQAQGLKLIQRNYLCRYGEIDLIMQEGAIVVFVEVRYRRNDRHGGAMESVDRRKQSRILTTASFFLKEKRHKGSSRFDVIALSPADQGFETRWLRDAFRVN